MCGRMVRLPLQEERLSLRWGEREAHPLREVIADGLRTTPALFQRCKRPERGTSSRVGGLPFQEFSSVLLGPAFLNPCLPRLCDADRNRGPLVTLLGEGVDASLHAGLPESVSGPSVALGRHRRSVVPGASAQWCRGAAGTVARG
jgi:hypothetical protein